MAILIDINNFGGEEELFFNRGFLPTKKEAKIIIDACMEIMAMTDAEIKKANNEAYEDRMEEVASFEKREKKSREGYVYIVETAGLQKVGRCINPASRIKTYRTENPGETKQLFLVKCSDYIEAEKLLHNAFKKQRVRGEWFRLTPTDILRAHVIILPLYLP